MGDDLVQRLANIADEARAYGYAAFADEADNARGEIERLRAEVALFKSELERANALCMEEHGLRELAGRELEELRAKWSAAEARVVTFRVIERELAALRERIEKAPVADIEEDGRHDGKSSLRSAAIKAGYYLGKRVRLVVEG